MKRLINLSFTFVLLGTIVGIAQNSVQVDQRMADQLAKRKINTEDVRKSHDASQRGSFTFDLDLVTAETVYAQNLGNTVEGFAWDINQHFSDTDTNYSFTCKWVANRYDEIYDWANDVTYDYSSITITVDSFWFFLSHVNTSGLNDTIHLKVFQQSGGSGVATSNGGRVLNNTVLWDSMIITNASLTATPILSNFGYLAVPVGITVPQGTEIGQSVEFFGSRLDTFNMINEYRDDCFAACWAAPSLWPETGYNWFNLHQGTSNLSRIIPGGLYFDCNSSGGFDPVDCEDMYFQYWNMGLGLTVEAPLVAGATATETTICAGETTTLNANVSGGSGNFNIAWTPSSGLSNPSDATTDAAPTTNTTYTCTIIDLTEGDTVTTTVTINVADISVDVGGDQSIACGSTATLQATASGNTSGVSYAWSNNVNSFNNPNLSPGTYTVTVTNSFGCTATDMATISFSGVNGTVGFTPPDPVCQNVPAAFNSGSVGLGSGWTETWDFGGGQGGVGPTVNFTYTSIGNKVVILSADSGACHLEHSETITVVLESACDTTTSGIASLNQLEGTISIFPNPSAGEFGIHLDNFNNADLTVSVYSMNGQQVFNEQVNVSGSKVLDVDFSNLANGNYLIKVDDGEGIATQKLNLLK